MSETSEETAMPAVSPQENPPPDPNYSFYLKMKPLRTLKLAIEALLDPTFNHDGFGMVGSNSDALAISVKNNDNATATLLLKSSGMIKFQSNAPPSPMGGMLAPLHLISQGFPLNLDGDDNTVIIFHVLGTNRLCFEFGTVPPTGFWAEIVVDPHVTMFPYLTIFRAITVPVDDVREMIDYILEADDPSNDTFFIDWEEDFATFEIGRDKIWLYHLRQNERTFHGWFNWNYTRFVKEASILADEVVVYFLTVPEQHVLFRFQMGGLADLLLLENALLVIPDMSAEEGARDEDVSESIPLDSVSIPLFDKLCRCFLSL